MRSVPSLAVSTGLLFLMCAAACSSSSAQEDAGTESDTSTEAGDGDGDGEPAPEGSIGGSVYAAGGGPLAQAGGQFCGPLDAEGMAALCHPVEANEDGTFAKQFVEGQAVSGEYNFKWVSTAQEDTLYGMTRVLVDFTQGDDVVIDAPFYVPVITSFLDVGEEEVHQVDMTGGLAVTVDPTDAGTDWGFSPDHRVGGVMVPESERPISEVEGEAVVAMWAMAPYTAHSAEGTTFSFSIDTDLGLAPGTEVNFHELDKDSGWLTNLGSGVVAADGSAIEIDGGLHALTWLLVTTPK